MAVAAVFLAAAVLVKRPIRALVRKSRFAGARRDFHRQRERLEAKFVQLVQAEGRPDAAS